MARLFFMPQAVRVNSAGTPYAGAKANFYLTGTTTRADTFSDNALSAAHPNPVVADAEGQFEPIFLTPGTTYRCVVTTSADVPLDDVDPVHAPFDGTAVSIADAGGYFAGSDVETILQDIGANYAVLADDEDISGDWTVSGSINFQDNELIRALLRDFAVKTQVVTSASNAIALDITQGNSVKHLLTENTTITLSGASPSDELCQVELRIVQDGAGGAYTVAFAGGTITWGGGTTYVASTGNNAIDIVVLQSWDGGANWEGNFVKAHA